MAWPTSVIFDVVFIPLYAIAAVLNVINVVKHGRGKGVHFLSLLVFSLMHLVGNLLLVYEYKQNYTNINISIWGYILQSIGVSFIFSASLAFYSRARASFETIQGQQRTAKISKLLNLVNTAALVCVIVGYTTTSFVNSSGQIINPTLPVVAKVGTILYVVLMLVVGALALVGLAQATGSEAKLIRTALVIVVAIMLARTAYSTYVVFSGTMLMPKSIWAKFVLQYITDYAALLNFTGLGFVLAKVPETVYATEDVERKTSVDSTKPMATSANHWDHQHQQQQLQVPMHNMQQ